MTELQLLTKRQFMREAGRIAAKAMAAIETSCQAGVTTLELDALAHQIIREQGGIPNFLGYNGYPATICASVNQCVIHGIPNARKLREGDLVSIDLGAIVEGWHSDMAKTFMVGQVDEKAKLLVQTTEDSFWAGFEKLRAGARAGDFGSVVERLAKQHGFGIVKSFQGHGIGRNMHEEPDMPNFGRAGCGAKLKLGQAVACEPMLTMGDGKVKLLPDGWTVVTVDGGLSAHYEHTVFLGPEGPEVMTVIAPDVDGRAT